MLRPSVFKTDALNRTLPRPRLAGRHKKWQAGQDLNLQPVDLEATALPIELPAFAPLILPHEGDFGKSQLESTCSHLGKGILGGSRLAEQPKAFVKRVQATRRPVCLRPGRRHAGFATLRVVRAAVDRVDPPERPQWYWAARFLRGGLGASGLALVGLTKGGASERCCSRLVMR